MNEITLMIMVWLVPLALIYGAVRLVMWRVAVERLEVIAEAVKAIQAEDLFDDTGTPSDEAYRRAVRDCAVAVERLA